MTTKVTIKCSDMPEKIQLEAISQGIQAYFRNPPNDPENPSDSYMKIAEEIKREFDHKYKKTWHCIVGENFGSFITHESNTFIFFQIAQISILLFKSAKVEQ
jgi:dynein light chain LC8-type